MNKQLYALLIFHTACNIGLGFVVLFVNLYIWQDGKSLIDLLLFNIALHFLWAPSFAFGSYLMRKTSLKTSAKVGSIFFVIFFMFISFGNTDNWKLWILIAGALFGIAKAVLNLANTQALAMLGNDKDHIKYYQLRDLWTQFTNVFSPILFAVLIFIFGYQNIFIFMLIYASGLFLLSKKLPDLKINIKKTNNTNEWMEKSNRLLELFSGKRQRLLPLSYITGAVFSEFQNVFLTFFTFTITSNQLLVAVLYVIYTLLTFFCIKFYHKHNISDEMWLFIGLIFAFSGFGLAIFLEDWWLLIPNILLVFGNFYYRTTFYANHFQAIDDLDTTKKYKINIWREFFLSYSRIVFLIFVLCIDFFLGLENYMWVIVGAALISSSCVPFIHRTFQLNKQN